MAFWWEPPNWANEAAGAGLVRASVRAHAEMMDASTKEVFGTGHWCGKNFTVSENVLGSGLWYIQLVAVIVFRSRT